MKWLTLDYIKQHSRIDYDCEDALLELYGAAAEDTVLNYLNRTFQDMLEAYGDVPMAIRQATLMLVDVSYQHRSPVTPTNVSLVPYTFDILVKPYMRLAGSTGGDDVQTVTLGSDVKIAFSAELPDGLTMREVPFTVTVYNADKQDAQVVLTKDACIMINDNEYVALVDTETLGVGIYMLKVVFEIPDTDYPLGYRRQVVRINPNVKCNG